MPPHTTIGVGPPVHTLHASAVTTHVGTGKGGIPGLMLIPLGNENLALVPCTDPTPVDGVRVGPRVDISDVITCRIAGNSLF